MNPLPKIIKIIKTILPWQLNDLTVDLTSDKNWWSSRPSSTFHVKRQEIAIEVPQQLGHEGWSEAKFSADGIHHADPARCPWWRFGAFTGRLGAKSCKINLPSIPAGKLRDFGYNWDCGVDPAGNWGWRTSDWQTSMGKYGQQVDRW